MSSFKCFRVVRSNEQAKNMCERETERERVREIESKREGSEDWSKGVAG